MTIQDILDQLKISKGAFYHYFDSKADVLEALVERMVVEQVQPQFTAIVQDPHMNALEKLQRYFDASVTWKTAQKDFVMELVKVWYSDENVLAREKVLAKMEQYVTPLFSEIIQQGVREGTFTTPYPEYASQVNINMIQSLGDTFARLLLSEESKQPAALQKAAAIVAAYTDALERSPGRSPIFHSSHGYRSTEGMVSTGGCRGLRKQARLRSSRHTRIPGPVEALIAQLRPAGRLWYLERRFPAV